MSTVHIVEENRHLIVSAGLGVSILPLRLGTRPEIVHLTLGAEKTVTDAPPTPGMKPPTLHLGQER
jgi:hypothetical protein